MDSQEGKFKADSPGFSTFHPGLGAWPWIWPNVTDVSSGFFLAILAVAYSLLSGATELVPILGIKAIETSFLFGLFCHKSFVGVQAIKMSP